MTAETLISEALKAEIDILVDADRYERCLRRKGLRNGYYERRLISRYGLLNIRVPRIREGEVAFRTLSRYRRYSELLTQPGSSRVPAPLPDRQSGPTGAL